jgi:ATP-binding cassette subfamily G (WHITE) protein 1/ATP-binding cassette subfamily G (WHITE) protein 2
VAQVTVFAVACYFMMGFQASAAKFGVWWAVLVLFALASETLGYMAAIATPDSKVGVAVLSILLVFLLSFSGYLVSGGCNLSIWCCCCCCKCECGCCVTG